jgi:hypothetical protein
MFPMMVFLVARTYTAHYNHQKQTYKKYIVYLSICFRIEKTCPVSPWSWSYGYWIYNFICNQCLSPLTFWVLISLSRGILDTTLCDKVGQWLATGRWYSPGTLVSSTNEKTCHGIAEIVFTNILFTGKFCN